MNEPTEREWELYKAYMETRLTEFEKRFGMFQRSMEARFDDFTRTMEKRFDDFRHEISVQLAEMSRRLDDMSNRLDNLHTEMREERRENRLMFRWVMGTQLALIATIAAKGFNLI